MKKNFIIALAVIASAFTYSCGNSGKNAAETTQSEQSSAMTVDQVLADAPNLVGDTITFEGVCSHLCKHGGRKAFVLGSNDSLLLRCEAYPIMGTPFSKESIHKPIKVNGILKEERVDEKAIAEMEHQYAMLNNTDDASAQFGESAEKTAEPTGGCDTERAARGQQNLTSFADRIADYRARIAQRNEKEGKPYLSFYYLEAISYEILPE